MPSRREVGCRRDKRRDIVLAADRRILHEAHDDAPRWGDRDVVAGETRSAVARVGVGARRVGARRVEAIAGSMSMGGLHYPCIRAACVDGSWIQSPIQC